MVNITLALPAELHSKMKEHTEIRWSEVVRKAISEKIKVLEQVKDFEEIERIASKSKLTQKDVEEISNKIKRSVAKKLGLR